MWPQWHPNTAGQSDGAVVQPQLHPGAHAGNPQDMEMMQMMQQPDQNQGFEDLGMFQQYQE